MKGPVHSYKGIQSRKNELIIKDVYSCKDNFKGYFDWHGFPPTSLTTQELLPSDPSVHGNLSTDSAVGHRVRPTVSGENLPSENIESANTALPHTEYALQSLPAPAKEVYKCDVCPYQTNISSSLNVHYRKHTGEKPYKCSFCSYSTPYRSHLTEHIRTHTGEKPYNCSYCSYSATKQCLLTVHIRTHTGEKPYKCSYCSYSATSHSNLTVHIRTHTGEKPFGCPYCSKKAIYKKDIKTHIYNKHPTQQWDSNVLTFPPK